ncbi:tetratricopeptide TPR_2 repeat protein [Oleiphilus messinensis]|uniref:Tetratricopeptide TPR_2 repeat protein n=1 Tax=Oleiphilus messinensis TaxID=141451 RepID=A0A1Y0ICH6_9GAMM|nr:tetratricopeptide repeat protein [Oleiphilus messinensis]ARU57094.1 tetratricopeptide TPR_2 repeat protein [Oleiphilus messinensis]
MTIHTFNNVDSISKTQWLLVIALFLTAIIYIPGIQGPSLLDDHVNLVINDKLHIQDLGIESLYGAATSIPGPYHDYSPLLNRPISYLSFALQFYFSDDPKSAFKTANIIIHLLCGIAVFFLTKILMAVLRSTGSHTPSEQCQGSETGAIEWIPLLVTVIWLLHPLMVSTVLYNVQRMTQLSTLFSLVALSLFVITRKTLSRSSISEVSSLTIIAGFCSVLFFTALAFLSKQNGILTLLLCLVIEACFFRFKFHPACNRGILLSYRLAAAMLILSWLSMLIYFYFKGNPNLSQVREFTLDQRLLTEARVLWEYLYWFIYPIPANLHFLHDNYPVSQSLFAPVTTLISVAGWITLLGIALLCLWLNRLPLLSFGILWYLVAHSMESTTIPLELVFEHRNYLPYVGPLFSLIAALVPTIEQAALRPLLKGLILCSVILIPALLTLERVSYWSSEEKLIDHWVEVNPQSPRVWAKVANFYFQAGQPDASFKALTVAESLNPVETGYVMAQMSLACAYPQRYNVDTVRQLRERILSSLQQPPTTSYTSNQLAIMIQICENPKQMKFLKPIFQMGLNSPKRVMVNTSNYGLAVIAAEAGNLREAREHLNAVLKNHPEHEAAQALLKEVDRAEAADPLRIVF